MGSNVVSLFKANRACILLSRFQRLNLPFPCALGSQEVYPTTSVILAGIPSSYSRFVFGVRPFLLQRSGFRFPQPCSVSMRFDQVNILNQWEILAKQIGWAETGLRPFSFGASKQIGAPRKVSFAGVP